MKQMEKNQRKSKKIGVISETEKIEKIFKKI